MERSRPNRPPAPRFPTDRMNDSSYSQPGFVYLVLEKGRFNLKHDAENCSSPNLAAHFDAATVFPDDILSNPQAQTRSFFASGKERIEDACEIIFRDTDAAIAELDHNRGLQRLFVTRRPDLYLAFTFNCLLRIDNQVEKDLPQLIRARPDERQRLV